MQYLAVALLKPQFTAFSACFIDQTNIVNSYGAVNCFDHIVDRERGIANRDQRFHLNSCLSHIFDSRGDANRSKAFARRR